MLHFIAVCFAFVAGAAAREAWCEVCPGWSCAAIGAGLAAFVLGVT